MNDADARFRKRLPSRATYYRDLEKERKEFMLKYFVEGSNVERVPPQPTIPPIIMDASNESTEIYNAQFAVHENDVDNSHSNDHEHDENEMSENSSHPGSIGEDSEIEIPFNEVAAPSFEETLKKFMVDTRMPRHHVSRLLKILRQKVPTLPMDYRTFLKTPQKPQVKDMKNGGKYCHFNIKNEILCYIFLHSLEDNKPESLTLNIFIDGIAKGHSSKTSFWIIAGFIVEFDYCFAIGVYEGSSKPTDRNEFLKPCVDDLLDISENGVEGIRIQLLHFIADLQAKSYILGIKASTGFFACARCVVKGETVSFTQGSKTKICRSFEGIEHDMRTDQMFRDKVGYTNDGKNSHFVSNKKTELERLNIDMVKAFKVDYMHCACLGVGKRLLEIWEKLLANFVKLVSAKIKDNKKIFEFQRRLTTIEIKLKATEIRQFILYYGPVVLKDLVPENMYNHFMLFSLALRIMSSVELLADYINIAENMINTFVSTYPTIYPGENIVLNIHLLIHLVQDCREYGVVDNFSAFQGENFLGKLRNHYKGGRYGVEQINNRIEEDRLAATPNCSKQPNPAELIFQKPLKNAATRYEQFSYKGFRYSIKEPNNIVKIGNSCGIVTKIYKDESGQQFIGIRPVNEKSDFMSPIATDLGFYCATFGDEEVLINVEDISGKCLNIDAGNNTKVICSMLHSNIQ